MTQQVANNNDLTDALPRRQSLLVFVTQTESLILFRNNPEAGALIECKGRIECNDRDRQWHCLSAGFGKQHTQNFRSNAAVLERCIDVEFFYHNVAAVDSGLQIAGIIAAGDDDAHFSEHKFLFEPRILSGIIPAAVQPLSEPPHAGVMETAGKIEIGCNRGAQVYFVRFNHRSKTHPASLAFTIPLALAISI
jgi:hypothetical protein